MPKHLNHGIFLKNRCFLVVGVTLLLVLSCSNAQNTSFKSKRQVTLNSYDSLNIPSFFTELSKNHVFDYYKRDSQNFMALARELAIKSNDSANKEKYFTIQLLHDLFTASSAYNGSKGQVLNIPYLWHWVNPNPRHNIRFAANGKLLKNTKPPKEFAKYGSYADIDRTPYLFLSQMVSEEPLFYAEDLDTFSTFGWCSEREMAFTCLLHCMEYQCKVMAVGNHSWTELIVPMAQENGKIKNYKVQVDNTFDQISWSPISNSKIPQWKTNFGNTKRSGWYAKKAKSTLEISRLKKHMVSKKASERIENKLVLYLKQ